MRFRIPLAIALLALGIWWCKEVFQRLPKDVQTFKESRGGVERPGLAAIWAVTALILGAMAYLAWYVATNGLKALRF
jgi:hypothetical protein